MTPSADNAIFIIALGKKEGEDRHLLLLSKQLLDIDMQPSAEDFSIHADSQHIPVKAVQLSCSTNDAPYPSIIALLTEQPLPACEELRVCYQPKHFLMWSLSEEQSIDPFGLNTSVRSEPAFENLIYDLPEPEELTADHISDKSNDAQLSSNKQADATDYASAELANSGHANLQSEQNEDYIFNTEIQDIPKDYQALSTFDKYVADILDIDFINGDNNKDSSREEPPEQVSMPSQEFAPKIDGHSHSNQDSKTERTGKEGDKKKAPNLERLLTIFMLFLAFSVGVILLFLIYFFIQFLDGGFVSSGKENTTNEIIASKTKDNFCTVEYPNGRYEGECLNGKGAGQGRFYWNSGDRYEGEWMNEKKQGKGVLSYQSGDLFDGEFKDDLKHGYGKMRWSSGTRYEGEYQYDKFHGEGVYWTKKGDRYEGKFHNGRFTQDGTCYRRDGGRNAGPCKP